MARKISQRETGKVFGPTQRFKTTVRVLCGFLGVVYLMMLAVFIVDIINGTGPAAPDASGRIVTAGIALFLAGC